MSASAVLGAGPELEILSPHRPGLVEVYCDNGELNAHAQITFIDTPQLPVANPYGGGVALFKLRRLTRQLRDPVGTQRTGLPSLDAKLRRLRAWASAARRPASGETDAAPTAPSTPTSW